MDAEEDDVSSPRPLEGDVGFTLAEVVMSMAVTTIAVTISTTAFVQVYRVLERTDAAATAQLQIDVAYRRLDRELRYASAFSQPAVLGGDAYVEYASVQPASPNATPPDTATRSICGELRLSGSTRQLQYRTWDPGTQPISPTAWRPLADAVQPGSAAVSAAQPFTLLPADATNNQQRLRVSLASTAGGAGAALRRDASVTYGALNSDPSKATDTVCTAGRSLP